MNIPDTLWATKVLTRPGALMARMAGCAFWVARYRGRDDVHEWDVDWSLAPKRGMTELRLVCPNGRILVLGSIGGGDMAGRFFQLKVGTRAAVGVVEPNGQIGFAPTGATELQAHIIGRLDDANGHCTIHAWEPGWALRYREPYDDTRPWDFQEPANDGSGGVRWKEPKTITEKHGGRTVENVRCRIEPMEGQRIKLVGYQDNVLTGLAQDVLGMGAD